MAQMVVVAQASPVETRREGLEVFILSIRCLRRSYLTGIL
jgi:hypothetical protein